MSQKTRSHGIAVSTLVSAVSLMFGTAAYGSYVPGHIDPGGNLTVPGFNGDAVFNVANNCFTQGNGFFNTNGGSGSGACGLSSVYSATIDLYSTDPSTPPAGSVLDSFTLGTSSTHGLGLSTFDISRVLIAGGQLAGVDTNPMGPVQTTGFYNDDFFWLQFTIFPIDPAYIYDNTTNSISTANLSNPGTVIFGAACTDPNNCRVAAAPEPGTLGLILGALGGGWLARRRKEKSAAA
jgi:hypothetical protein